MNNLFNGKSARSPWTSVANVRLAKDDERTAGLSYLRVSLGASDLSPSGM
jgi:hypothetical protein